MLAGYDPLRDSQGFYFDPEAAELPIEFCENMLCHVKGGAANQPFILEDWQKEFVKNIFGWKDQKGYRRYRQAYLEVPRKNGKSTLAAFLGLYFLGCDKEQGAEIYLAASDRDQASLVYDVMAGMIRKSPYLKQKFRVLDSKKRILFPQTNSFISAIAADAASAHGYNSHFICFDELHAQPNRELFDVLSTSTGSRRQPFFLSITTAGHDKHSICWLEHEYAAKVRDGVIIDPHYLPVIFAAKPDDDWTKKETWQKANPCYGVAISGEYLEKECKKAQEQPSYENTFKRLHLNLWTEQEVRWLKMADFQECCQELPDLSKKECWAGLDLSSTLDLSSLVLAFPVDDKVYLKAFFWMPENNAEYKERVDKVPYRLWNKDPKSGLTLTKGNVIDYRYIENKVLELADLYNIQEIRFDRYNATEIVQNLTDSGVNMIQMGQGFVSMSAPAKELEKRVIEHSIIVDNPVFTWQASNVSVATDAAGNIKPVKPEHHDSKRIDGIVAAVMALSGVMARQKQVGNYRVLSI